MASTIEDRVGQANNIIRDKGWEFRKAEQPAQRKGIARLAGFVNDLLQAFGTYKPELPTNYYVCVPRDEGGRGVAGQGKPNDVLTLEVEMPNGALTYKLNYVRFLPDGVEALEYGHASWGKIPYEALIPALSNMKTMGSKANSREVYDVLSVSRDSLIRKKLMDVLQNTGIFPSESIMEADDEGNAMRTIDAVLGRGGRIGVVIEHLTQDNVNACNGLLFHSSSRDHPIPVIVTSMYDSKSVATSSGLTVAEALIQQAGAYAHVRTDAKPLFLPALVLSALDKSWKAYGQGG